MDHALYTFLEPGMWVIVIILLHPWTRGLWSSVGYSGGRRGEERVAWCAGMLPTWIDMRAGCVLLCIALQRLSYHRGGGNQELSCRGQGWLEAGRGAGRLL